LRQISNIERLVIRKVSLDAIPASGGIADGVAFLLAPDRLASSTRAAAAWVESAVLAVRNAGDPNPWRSATSEAIAGEILRQIDELERSRRGGRP
jgi:hypothetical protein